MGKFVIAPHMRLHEWVARDKGYFNRVGLDYEFSDQLRSGDGKLHDLGDKVGAYQTFERGRSSNINCACHWTINVAASVGHGKLYPHAYSVAPAAVLVPPESQITHPAQLAGVPISVGYQSGSHYSTIQALEQYLGSEEIKLSFADGLLFRRMEKLIDRQVPAASVFSGPYYFLEQLGFRKVIDSVHGRTLRKVSEAALKIETSRCHNVVMSRSPSRQTFWPVISPRRRLPSG